MTKESRIDRVVESANKFITAAAAGAVTPSKAQMKAVQRLQKDPVFRRDLREAIKTWFHHQVEVGAYDDPIDEGVRVLLEDLEPGGSLTYKIGVSISYNDSIFMPLLWEQAKGTNHDAISAAMGKKPAR